MRYERSLIYFSISRKNAGLVLLSFFFRVRAQRLFHHLCTIFLLLPVHLHFCFHQSQTVALLTVSSLRQGYERGYSYKVAIKYWTTMMGKYLNLTNIQILTSPDNYIWLFRFRFQNVLHMIHACYLKNLKLGKQLQLSRMTGQFLSFPNNSEKKSWACCGSRVEYLCFKVGTEC